MAVIVCPICSTRYRVTDAQLSKASRLKCKKCKTVFPVSDNIKDEQTDSVPEAGSVPEVGSVPESGGASSFGNLEFPGSPTPQTRPNDSEASENFAPDGGSDEMTLDFNFSSDSRQTSVAPTLDFSFSAITPDPSSQSEDREEVAIEDHISNSLHNGQGHLDVGLGGLALTGGPNDGETTLSMDGGSLDFSFSAVMPETPPDAGEEEGARSDAGEIQDLSLGLDLGPLPDDATMTMSDSTSGTSASLNLDISLTEGSGEAVGGRASGYAAGVQGEDVRGDQEPLDTCCVDSLAMGMTTCELCGRNLQGVDSQQFLKQRHEQLRSELPEGESHVGFSGESGPASIPIPGDEDFSDVERALDALADGTFEKEIKKREAHKHRGKRLKFIGVGAVLGVILIIGAGVMLLPSGHERLLGQYEDLMNRPEIDPKMLVELFFDAAARQDHDIFQKISVMPTMPDITGGSVVNVGEEYEHTSLGQLGKDVATLETELATLQATYQSTEKQWKEASAVDLSPNMVKGNIDQLLQKQASLQAEFDEKEQESFQKTNGLEADIREAEQELEINRQRAQQYIDATDKQGKAMYTASIRNQQSLSDKLGKLEGLLADERLSHANRMRALEAEYTPQFQKFAEDIAVRQALYEKAVLYADSEKSPLIVLDAELKALKNTIAEAEQTLKQKQEQLALVFDFFKRQDRRQQAEQSRNDAEFTHVSMNVVASVKFRGAGKQQVPIILKRYQAVVGDQTIQGDWVVESILR